MKRLILLAITCIVVDQDKVRTGWKTECRGREVNGEVILEEKIMHGQLVTYRPYVSPDDEIIHGEIISITDAPAELPELEISSDVGKPVPAPEEQ